MDIFLIKNSKMESAFILLSHKMINEEVRLYVPIPQGGGGIFPIKIDLMRFNLIWNICVTFWFILFYYEYGVYLFFYCH